MTKRVLAAVVWILAATGVAWAGDGSCRTVQNPAQNQTDVRPCLPFALPGTAARCLNCPAVTPVQNGSGQALCVTVRPALTENVVPGHFVHGRCVPDTPGVASSRAVRGPRLTRLDRGVAAPPRLSAPPRFAPRDAVPAQRRAPAPGLQKP